MNTDLEQFHQVFFEEAEELLAEMERLLLELDADSPSPEDLNAIFRASHSIKGGASTFGFSDMAEVTHVMESLLDRLRRGEVRVSSGMIDAFLRATDVLKLELAAHRGNGEADRSAAAEVCARLKEFSAEGAAGDCAPSAGSRAPAAAPKTFLIEFDLAGVNEGLLENLLSDLRRRGTLENLRERTAGQNGPDGDGSGSGRCLLRLTTAASEEDLWEALAFVVDPARLRIEIEAARATNAGGDYGFFQEPVCAPAAARASEARDSTGVAPGDSQQARSFGRRLSDDPEAGAVRTGRRQSDKVAVSPVGESSSIRVSVEKVDHLINLVGELVITQAMLAQTGSRVDPVLHESLLNSLDQLERNTRDLQEAVMSIRMMPISFAFSRFPRLVRDLAARLGKEVELRTVGEGTELDKGLIEKIVDPLTHLVRNSLDHGIESPAERVAAGKPPRGTITLRAFHQSGNVIVEVSDDGRGLSRERILAKAKERGMAVSDSMSDQEVWSLIFEPGFSTAAVVTDVSGRGVGMDVVKRNISALGGRVEIDSAVGQGTSITIRLPLTLAILDGLSVSVGKEIFIVPLTYIVESLQPSASQIKTVGGRGRLVHVRGEYLPLVALHEVLRIRPEITEAHQGIVVILEAEGRKTAMLVDRLVGQHQVVIKSLESNYRRVYGISGATIMGDGKVAMILDAVAIAQEGRMLLAEAA